VLQAAIRSGYDGAARLKWVMTVSSGVCTLTVDFRALVQRARIGEVSTLPSQPPQPLEAQQLRLLVEQMPAIVWTVDSDERYTSVAGAGLEPLGVQAAAVDVLMREALDGSEALGASMTAHRHALRGRVSRYTAGWADRLFECRVEPLRVDDRIVGSIGAAVDVTEKRQVEAALFRAYEEGVECLVRAIESRDIVTGRHVERMSTYCSALAQAVGLDCATCQAIGVASRLHDVGKIGVPDTLLLKEAALTDDERMVIQRHCQAGHDILAGAESEILQLAAEIALNHHEWFDGTGYPRGLAGEEIPLTGQIAAIADVFDALTSHRPYRAAFSVERAKAAMIRERGTHFDPSLLDLFLALDLPVNGSDGADGPVPGSAFSR
jgi:hypothetical protein